LLRAKEPSFNTPPMLLHSTHHPCSLRILASYQKGSFKSILFILAKKHCVDCTLELFQNRWITQGDSHSTFNHVKSYIIIGCCYECVCRLSLSVVLKAFCFPRGSPSHCVMDDDETRVFKLGIRHPRQRKSAGRG